MLVVKIDTVWIFSDVAAYSHTQDWGKIQNVRFLVEMRRIELLTPCLQGRCSPSWATPPNFIRYFVKTPWHTLSIVCVVLPRLSWNYSQPSPQLLSSILSLFGLLDKLQNRYSLDFLRRRRVFLYARLRKNSKCAILVGLSGLEPPTSRLSGVRSNRLSYRPMLGCIVPR